MKKIIFIFLLASISVKAQWSLVSSTGTMPFVSVSFINPDDGFIMANYRGFSTIDGGNTLDTLVNLYVWSNFPYNTEVFHLTDSLAYVITMGPFGGLIVNKTIDRGVTWNDLSPNYLTQGIFRSDFVNTQTGYIYSSFEDSLWITFDGGLNWTHTHLSFSLQSGTSEMPAIDFVNDSTGYLVGGDGTFAYKGVIARTEDYGQTWSLTILPESYSTLVSVNFPSADTGFALTSYGGVYRTVDEGQSWDSISSMLPITNSKIYFITPNTGFIITGPDIYKSVDGGLSWNLNYTDTSDLYAICFTDSLNGYVVGEYGTILKTTNAGGTLNIDGPGSKNHFQIFPNPVKDLLHVTTDINKKYSLIIYNSHGQIIDILKGSGDSIFKLKGVTRGLYTYTIMVENQFTGGGKFLKIED